MKYELRELLLAGAARDPSLLNEKEEPEKLGAFREH